MTVLSQYKSKFCVMKFFQLNLKIKRNTSQIFFCNCLHNQYMVDPMMTFEILRFNIKKIAQIFGSKPVWACLGCEWNRSNKKGIFWKFHLYWHFNYRWTYISIICQSLDCRHNNTFIKLLKTAIYVLEKGQLNLSTKWYI